MNRKLTLLLLSLVLLLLIPACGGSKLVYKVIGGATEAQVEYTNAQGETKTEIVALPWETGFDAGSSFNFKLKAENKSDSGSVTCEVWINDRRAGSASGVGLAECTGSFSGSSSSYSTNFQGRYDAAPQNSVETVTPPDRAPETQAVAAPTRPAAREKTVTQVSLVTRALLATPTAQATVAAPMAVDLTQERVRYADRPAWQRLLGWPDECEATFQLTSLQKPDGDGGVSFYDVGGKYLVFVACTLGPYWVEERLYLLDNQANPPSARPLTVPELAQEDTQGWVLHEVEQIHGLSIFHPDTRTLTNLVPYRGLKDCGIFYTYRFEQVSFALEEARYHDCDDEGILSDRWEVIYPTWAGDPVMAAPPPQIDSGQEYTVQAGDCLARLAERFYGSQRFWPAIWQTTNDQAAGDSRFTLISDPQLILVGQKLWLPPTGEVESLLAGAGLAQSGTGNTTGLLTVDLNYIGDWYRDTFNYSKEAPNIRHFAVVMTEAQYQKNRGAPGHICSSLSFPGDDGVLKFRDDLREVNWDLAVLHPIPYQAELEPGRYYVGGCFIAAPLSRQEAGVGDDVILYAGITGGGASSDYQVVTIEAGARQDITIILTDRDGWACPWVYVFNGQTFERRTEILRNLKSKALETTQRHNLGSAPVQDGVVRLQIREEKPEITYLDLLYLEVKGKPVWPDVKLLTGVDGHYLVLQPGDIYELTFDVSAVAGGSAPVEATIVSAGYYISTSPTFGND